MAEWVPSGQKVNQQYCIEVLTKLHERVRRNRPELWRNVWILHQDNAPGNNALSVKLFLANKNISMLEHPPHSPDLAPCDFYLFPKIKSVLKGTAFLSVEDVKAKTVENFNSLTEHYVRNCFEHWQHRMRLRVNLEGDYFEGDRSLLNRKSYRQSRFFCVGLRKTKCDITKYACVSRHTIKVSIKGCKGQKWITVKKVQNLSLISGPSIRKAELGTRYHSLECCIIISTYVRCNVRFADLCFLSRRERTL